MNYDLPKRIRASYYLLLIPSFLTLIFLLLYNHSINERYETMLSSVSAAGNFNTEFKKDFDLETYLLIAGNVKPEESMLPKLLSDARGVINELKDYTDNEENMQRLNSCGRYLDNLEGYIDLIVENLQYEGKYDDNIMIWENDVQIVTALIQEGVNEYIYEENRLLQSAQETNQKRNAIFLVVIGILMTVVLISALVISMLAPKIIARPIEEQVRAKQDHLRRAEFELLQAQINPHFLYNTLDTIIWSAESGDEKQVVRMTKSLSDFFRTSLSKGKRTVTLRDDLIHMRSYLQIQQIRYQDILKYEIDLPEKFLDAKIPKITMQPVVENAIYHGIKNKRGGGTIRVTAEENENGFTVHIADDGIGMSKERLEEVRAGIRNQVPEQSAIYGLYNVNERIRMDFGEAYGLRIDSEYGKGTVVSINLPMQNAE